MKTLQVFYKFFDFERIWIAIQTDGSTFYYRKNKTNSELAVTNNYIMIRNKNKSLSSIRKNVIKKAINLTFF